MTREFLYNCISKYKLAVVSTVSDSNLPEAAVVGFAVTPELKIIFDTVTNSRKYENLVRNPSIALVIGWDNEITIQYEGKAKIPSENELEFLLPYYFKVYPDGVYRKKNWKNIVYFVVEPTWIRFSDFNLPQPIEELRF